MAPFGTGYTGCEILPGFGPFANPRWLKALAWLVAVVIAALNVYLLWQTLAG